MLDSLLAGINTMNQWLYNQILRVDPDRQPVFALQSSLNWIAALSAEVAEEHGGSQSDQLDSHRGLFKQTVKPSSSLDQPALVFEPLFSAISGAMALQSVDSASLNYPWCRPSSIVSWYYTIYTSSRAILASLGLNPAETHAATQKAFVSSIQPQLPHPFNMLAVRMVGEDYSLSLPQHPLAAKYPLTKNLSGVPGEARGMLLSYLSGTADWYCDREKERLKEREKIKNFRTKKSKEIRDKHIEPRIGFLHCAYRYRGKANYRDGIFLSYGLREPASGPRFTQNLADTSSFFVLMAIAFVERRLGREIVQRFLEDLGQNFRSLDQAGTRVRFWEVAVGPEK